MGKSKIRTLLFCLFFFFFTTSLAKHRCHQDDKNTLLKIKKSLNNPHGLSTWDIHTDCCSSWSGVSCNETINNRVTGLFIGDDDKLSGQIPPEVGDLTYLESLVFQMLPNLTGNIPPTITKLKNLVSFWVISASLSGHIPEFLGHLKNIQVLDLSFNKLSGPIPYSLGLLPNLYSLDISDNKLSGRIPLSLGTVNFYYIDISSNKLEGDASMLFGAKKTTETINLSRNMFNFKLSKVKVPKTLRELNLNHNRINGNIPAQWTKAPLEGFNVSYNQLCGRIPTGGNLQKFASSSYFHNKCLCGAPLQPCK